MTPNTSRSPLFGELVQIFGCLLLLAVAIGTSPVPLPPPGD